MIVAQLYNYQHRLSSHDVLIKTSFVALAMILVLLSGSMAFYVVSCGLFFALTCFVTRISLPKIIRLYRIPFLFLLVGTLTLALKIEWGTGKFPVVYDDDMAGLAYRTFLKSWAVVSVAYFWLLTNSISELADLLKRLKVPTLFIELFVLTYKFIFFTIKVSRTMYLSQQCRLGFSRRKNIYKHISYLFYSVWTQSFQLATQSMKAMESRLYNGDLTFVKNSPTRDARSLWGHAFAGAFYSVLYFLL